MKNGPHPIEFTQFHSETKQNNLTFFTLFDDKIFFEYFARLKNFEDRYDRNNRITPRQNYIKKIAVRIKRSVAGTRKRSPRLFTRIQGSFGLGS